MCSTRLFPASVFLYGFLGLICSAPAGYSNEATVNDSQVPVPVPPIMLTVLGDSLSHGTMDATNNYVNTWYAYVQRVYYSLRSRGEVFFRQPYFDLDGKRLQPFLVPTNLGVDGADAFSLEGLEYYKRVGAEESFVSPDLLGDGLAPGLLNDKYDKVLYPINLFTRGSASQVDAALWLVNEVAPALGLDEVFLFLWIGNNDSSLAALGAGGANPQYQPLPLEEISPEISPVLDFLLRLGQIYGAVSFEPYTPAALERNLTSIEDFTTQYEHLLSRLTGGSSSSGANVTVFVMTLPYYSAVGYLFDSEDLEFYLQKLDPAYTVPPTFERVALPGTPIEEPLSGDRTSLLTFGFMYALLESGYSVDYVNRALEINGEQRDGLVLSEAEQRTIMARIDAFNAAIKALAAAHGPNVHAIDVGRFLNGVLTGEWDITIGGRPFNRKWVRGGGFSLDGVHPGYTGQTLIANYILYDMNRILGLGAPLYDLNPWVAADPYVDWDQDGWARGPSYEASGISSLLLMFRDPDDGNASIQVDLPPDVWTRISNTLLTEILEIPVMQAEASYLGIEAPRN